MLGRQKVLKEWHLDLKALLKELKNKQTKNLLEMSLCLNHININWLDPTWPDAFSVLCHVQKFYYMLFCQEKPMDPQPKPSGPKEDEGECFSGSYFNLASPWHLYNICDSPFLFLEILSSLDLGT